jgi:hypothetical protein
MAGRGFPWICLLIVIPLQAQDADSIAYYDTRMQLIANGYDTTDAVLLAADELAAEGLYVEARSLLNDLGKTKTKPDTAAPKGSAPAPVLKTARHPPSWKISGAADYTHLEDVTTILTPEDEDSLARLREEPFTVSTKAILSLLPSTRFIESMDPSVLLSNQKAVVDCPIRGTATSFLAYEAIFKAEKRLTNTGSAIMGGDKKTVFLGGQKDSLDMAEGRLTIIPGVQGDDSREFVWKTPLTAETARYRHGRSGYYTYNYFRTIPELSWNASDMRENASLRLLGEYKDYFGESGATVSRADSFDIWRIGPEFSADIWRSRSSASILLGYCLEQYLHRGIPSEMRTFDAEAQARTKLVAGLEALVQAKYEQRNEYDKSEFISSRDTSYRWMGIPVKDTLYDTTKAEIQVNGYETEITPTLRWSFLPSITIEARCPLSLRTFSVIDSLKKGKLQSPLFIIESRKAIEPEIGIDYAGSIASIRAFGAYTAESIPVRDYYTQVSNRGWKARLDCTGKVRQGAFAYAQLEYHYRLYAPYDENSRVSKNTTAAGGFSVKF